MAAATEYFDDDEETLPIGFEQDPESDDIGDGTWIYADGSKKYAAGDPAMAKALMAKAPAPLGESGPYAPKPQTTPAPEDPSARAPIGPSADEEFLNSTTGAEEDEAKEAQPEASEQPKPFQALTAPQMPGARGPARYTDSVGTTDQQTASESDQRSVTRTGSAQDQGEYEQQQGDITKGYEAQKSAVDEGSQGVAGAIQARRQQLMQLAADKEAVTAATQASNETRKQQVIKKYQEVDSRKTDMNGLWKDKGALGTTLGLLGVALRSLTATKFGGPNTALQSIQEQKRQNLQAQMADRDSELRGLEKELGSLEAAAPMLEARMNDALSKRLEAMTLDEKSATVLANAKQLKAQLDTESAAKKAESAKAYWGTLAQQQAQSSQMGRTQGVNQERQRLSGAGVGDGPEGKTREQVYADLLEIDKKEEERGIPKEDRAEKWAAYGFKAPSGESAPETTNREQREKIARDEATLSEDQAKAENAMEGIGSFGDAAGLTRDPKTGKWKEPGVLSGTVKPGWSEPIGESVGQSTPVKDARVIAQEAVGRLQSGGMIGKEEGETFSSFFGSGEATRNQIASKLNQLETLVNSRRKARLRDAPTGPKGKLITPKTSP